MQMSVKLFVAMFIIGSAIEIKLNQTDYWQVMLMCHFSVLIQSCYCEDLDLNQTIPLIRKLTCIVTLTIKSVLHTVPCMLTNTRSQWWKTH